MMNWEDWRVRVCLKNIAVSEWTTPLVIVPKQNDYQTNINSVKNVDQYPLPHAEDIFATLAGGKCFFKIGPD